MEEKIWRSVKFPVRIVEEVSAIAEKEHRTFPAQLMVYIEAGLKSEKAKK